DGTTPVSPSFDQADIREFEESIAGEVEFIVVATKAATFLRDQMSTSISVIYGLDEGTNELVAIAVSSHTDPPINDFRIPLAQRLSGWVGANRETVLNSDAALD